MPIKSLPATADLPAAYAEWLADLKLRIHTAQQRAALAVNRELVLLYWQIGRDILARQAAQGWGAKVIEQLARDLHKAFPEMKGFSRANLMYMRAFADAWPDEAIVQQAVGHLPWGHNLVLLTKLKDADARLAYAQRAMDHGWSRNVLTHHIESKLLQREGQAVTNFQARLPAPGSGLAQGTLKDPYLFDFLGIGVEADKREIENALVRHISRSPPLTPRSRHPRTAPPSGCCFARRRIAWLLNTHCAIRTNPSVWRSTS
jgi:predicted nuclease of restriction endonuclease-like (RecB) superfamily